MSELTRRKLLGAIGAAGVASIAGCSRGGSSDEVKEPEFIGIQSDYADCGDISGGHAQITQGDDSKEDGGNKNVITIVGRIPVSSTCSIATYEGFEYNEGDDVGAISIGTDTDSDKRFTCEACDGSVWYRTRVEFPESLPSKLVVHHDGRGETGVVSESELSS